MVGRRQTALQLKHGDHADWEQEVHMYLLNIKDGGKEGGEEEGGREGGREEKEIVEGREEVLLFLSPASCSDLDAKREVSAEEVSVCAWRSYHNALTHTCTGQWLCKGAWFGVYGNLCQDSCQCRGCKSNNFVVDKVCFLSITNTGLYQHSKGNI